MSTAVKGAATAAATHDEEAGVSTPKPAPQSKGFGNYRGFVAGVFSGIAKLSVGHPFDTIKVRLQTAPTSQFKGPLDCLLQTVRKEGINGMYKGATPPLVGCKSHLSPEHPQPSSHMNLPI